MYKIKLTTKTINNDGKVTYEFTNYESKKYFNISKAFERLDKINDDFDEEEFKNEDDNIDMFSKYIINASSVRTKIRNGNMDEDLLVTCIRHNDTGITLQKSYTIEYV